MTPELHTAHSLRGDEFFTKVASRPPFTYLHPAVASFFKEYLSHEKAMEFQGRYVVNTHFPPFPCPRSTTLPSQFGALGDIVERSLYSVTFAVTNRCGYKCWHCYNAGRSQEDHPAFETQRRGQRTAGTARCPGDTLRRGAAAPARPRRYRRKFRQFDLPEPEHHRLRPDSRTRPRARGTAVFSPPVISIDSTNPDEHDRLRGIPGAFTTAHQRP